MDPVVPVIKKILEYRQSRTAIDVGAGLGHHAVFLAEHGFTVDALDTSVEAMNSLAEIARERNLPITSSVGDVRELTLDKQWDVVVCTFVLHFLQDEEVDKAIVDLKAITKPGGIVVVANHTTENNAAERARKPHLFAPQELKERFADWEVLYHWQGLGKPFLSKRTGETLQKYRAELIAQKPL